MLHDVKKKRKQINIKNYTIREATVCVQAGGGERWNRHGNFLSFFLYFIFFHFHILCAFKYLSGNTFSTLMMPSFIQHELLNCESSRAATVLLSGPWRPSHWWRRVTSRARKLSASKFPRCSPGQPYRKHWFSDPTDAFDRGQPGCGRGG